MDEDGRQEREYEQANGRLRTERERFEHERRELHFYIGALDGRHLGL
jgi:hypothetical protein